MVAMLASTREEQEDLGRDFDDLPAMISPNSIDEDEENEDRYSGDPDQVVNSSNPYDYPVVIMNIQFTNQLSRSMLPLDNTSRQTSNFIQNNRNMLPAGYEMGTSHDNRRTNNFRRNNSSRSNIPERMRHGRNSYRQNDSFSRNRNVPACFNHIGLRFSTTVPNDPDSHADFQQNNKGRSGSFSGISFMEVVENGNQENIGGLEKRHWEWVRSMGQENIIKVEIGFVANPKDCFSTI
ncbi:hypothetical protein Peur_002727 [Populus x canadensis]